MIRDHVQLTPERRVLSFVSTDPAPDTHSTYGELDHRTRAIASVLQRDCARGDRVLLLHRPGLEYVATFLACQYAGVVAVPAYPPDIGRLTNSLPRLMRVAADAQASLVATSADIAAVGGDLVAANSGPPLRWLATETVPDEATGDWRPFSPSPDDLAFLQYTSGTTRDPRGVRVTQRNLVANSEIIRRSMGHDRDSHGVIWLPPYHDMGLIGGVLQPLYTGFWCELMSPLTFLRSPMGWLERIARRQRVTSGGPNFAFEMCVRKTSKEERERLDLSGWRVAFCGAEPVRADTVARFTAAFAPAGFRRESLFPCYGLAEGTLMIAGGRRPGGPAELSVDSGALTRDEVRPPAGTARQLVGSGPVVPDHELQIVDPHTISPCPPDTVGEIWVAGPCVADGYWSAPQETERTFDGILPGRPATRYLRTGDLGFVRDGELYVTGRRSDLIIVDGRNFHPHHLEQTVESCHPEARIGGCVAFAVDQAGTEQIVLVQEVGVGTDPAPLFESIRGAMTDEHGVMPDAIVLVPPRTVPKTSSGKPQRARCREDYRHDRLRTIARWRLRDRGTPAHEPSGALPPTWQRHDDLVRYLTVRIGAALGPDGPRSLEPRTGFLEMGISSALAVELRNLVQADLDVSLPPSLLFDYPTIDALAGYLGGVLAAGGRSGRVYSAGRRPAPAASAPLEVER